MFADILSEVARFSRQTGIVDKNVDLLLNGLCKYPAKLFLFTPLNEHIYYTYDPGYDPVKEFKMQYMGEWPEKPKCEGDLVNFRVERGGLHLGRGIGVMGKPRGKGRFTGISSY